MNKERGALLAELLVVLAILGLGVGLALMNLRPMETPLQAGTSMTQGMFRQARLQAIATTSAFRVVPAGNDQLRAEYAGSCSDTSWTPDTKLIVDLPGGVSMSPTTWTVCFSSRGISTSNVLVTLSHPQYGLSRVEVLLGGTTRVM